MQKENSNHVKIMVVDDSAFMRRIIVDMIQEEPGLEVVAVARNGKKALELIPEHKPHVITMDIEMPELNGIETLQKIKQLSNPPNVIMLSSYTQTGSEETLRALELGAVDFVSKPSGPISLDIKTVKTELISKIKAAYHAAAQKTLHCHKKQEQFNLEQEDIKVESGPKIDQVSRPKVVVIGASTGGPRALHQLIPKFPKDFPGCILIVQHMPAGFTKLLGERLDNTSPMKVSEASENMTLEQGRVYIAPGNYHLKVKGHQTKAGSTSLNRWKLNVDDSPAVKGLRPCADILFESASEMSGVDLIGVVLTGMGNDGAKGVKRLKRANAYILAEDESTCVVFGMPKAAINTGLVDKVLPLPSISQQIMKVIT